MTPSALAMRLSMGGDGRRRPVSMPLMVGWVVFALAASIETVMPASMRSRRILALSIVGVAGVVVFGMGRMIAH